MIENHEGTPGMILVFGACGLVGFILGFVACWLIFG